MPRVCVLILEPLGTKNTLTKSHLSKWSLLLLGGEGCFLQQYYALTRHESIYILIVGEPMLSVGESAFTLPELRVIGLIPADLPLQRHLLLPWHPLSAQPP